MKNKVFIFVLLVFGLAVTMTSCKVFSKSAAKKQCMCPERKVVG